MYMHKMYPCECHSIPIYIYSFADYIDLKYADIELDSPYVMLLLLQVVYFVNSGSEANDLAMVMARLHTGNFDVISFRSVYK